MAARGILTKTTGGFFVEGSLRGANEAIAKLKSLDRSMQKRMIRKGTRKASQVAAKIMKRYAPRPAGASGTLKKSIGWRLARQRPVPTAAGIVGPRRRFQRVTARGTQKPTKYSYLVDRGTKPHAIHARKKRGMFFYINGQSVFVKSVRHPGARAQHFTRAAAFASRVPSFREFQRVVSVELALQAAKAKPSEVDDG